MIIVNWAYYILTMTMWCCCLGGKKVMIHIIHGKFYPKFSVRAILIQGGQILKKLENLHMSCLYVYNLLMINNQMKVLRGICFLHLWEKEKILKL